MDKFSKIVDFGQTIIIILLLFWIFTSCESTEEKEIKEQERYNAAYDRGYEQGYSDGYDAGCEDGYKSALEGN